MKKRLLKEASCSPELEPQRKWHMATNCFSCFSFRKLLSLSALLTLLATPAYCQDLLTNSLAIFFPFHGDFNDESGYGGYATPHPATLLWDRFGAPTNAVGFFGADYAVDWFSKHPGGEVTLTYSCWVFAERITAENQCLFSVASFYPFGGAIIPNTRSGLALAPGISNLFLVYTGQGNDLASGEPVLKTNEWHHIGLVKKAQAVQMFLDGELVASGFTQPGQNVPQGSALYIGRNGNSPGEQFYGRLDELRVYARALSASEVGQLYRLASLPSVSIVAKPAGLHLLEFNLFVDGTYQLETSADLVQWKDFGVPFQPELSGSSSQVFPITPTNAFWRLRNVP